MHFSPVLIDTELKRITGPEGAELNDEHMTIKVATAIDEITASYSIDEHQIEMTLKIPSNWPLQAIEAKDFKRAAIPENHWSTWIRGVQQIIRSQVRCSDLLQATGLTTSCVERKHCGWADSVQEECRWVLRGRGGVCYLLFVSACTHLTAGC
jgi:hypothetical protein